jgi:diguanylate cyclase (GGDEF)-like protein
MAVTDGLTGLYNRRAFEERLREEVQRTKRYLHSISLLMLDLDHFKRVNDTHGHVVGDEVLLEIAGIVRANIRSVDIPCRYGGEELCVIVPGTSLAGAETLAERLRRLMAEHEFHTPHGDTFHVTCSVGVSVFNGGADVSADDVINAADEALYCAKEQGRDRVVIRKLA